MDGRPQRLLDAAICLYRVRRLLESPPRLSLGLLQRPRDTL